MTAPDSLDSGSKLLLLAKGATNSGNTRKIDKADTQACGQNKSPRFKHQKALNETFLHKDFLLSGRDE